MNRLHFPALWAILPSELEALCATQAQLLADQAQPEAATPGQQIPGQDDLPYELSGMVAIIPVVGPMSKRGDWRMASMRSIGRSVRHAATNPRVRAILLDVDSPGGTVDGTEELAEEIRAAAGAKPLYAYANGLMASAAYWLASAARTIAAPATAQIGSIGVLMVHWEVSRLAENMGVSFNVITAGKYKAMGNSVEPLTDEARAYLQSGIDALYELFLDAVATGRKVDRKNALGMADGKVFLAAEALGIGLIDRLESRESFLTHINEEVRMDLTTLKKDAPGALSEHRAEVEAEMKAKAEQERAAAVAAEQARVVGLCAVILGQEHADKVSAVLASGITPDQLASVTKVMGAQAPVQQGGKVEEKLLTAIQGAHAPGLAPMGGKDVGAQSFEALVEAHMATASCSRAAATVHVATKNPEAHRAYLDSLTKKEA